MKTEKLWMRIGDAGDYQELSGYVRDDAADFWEMVGGPIDGYNDIFSWHKDHKGFDWREYRGENCVSLFWGNDVADFGRVLNAEEQADFEEGWRECCDVPEDDEPADY